MKNEIKLNRQGEIDLVHYQRMAEQARAEALSSMMLSLGSKIKQLVSSAVAKIRTVRLSRVLPSSIIRHVH